MLFNIYTLSTLLLRKKVYENILHRGMESTITKKIFDDAKYDNVQPTQVHFDKMGDTSRKAS